MFRLLDGPEVDKNQKNQHCQENNGGQCIHGRPDAAPHLAVNQGGQGVDARALSEVGNDEVI